ncbi:MAG TPA: DUF1801 domain-containing protein [Bacillus sp. (in: firmicutes)]
MEDNKVKFNSIDEYIGLYPSEIQDILTTLRKVIKESAPEATEKISYQMPTFAMHGNLVHFAAYKKHIGFYPAASGVAAFTDKLVEYKTSKGAIQFSIDKPLPYELIKEIVQFRVDENRKRAEDKLKNKKK